MMFSAKKKKKYTGHQSSMQHRIGTAASIIISIVFSEEEGEEINRYII